MSRKALTAESWLWLWHRPNPKIDHFFASWNEPSKYLWHQTYCGPWLCFHVSERRIITKNRNRSCACLYRTTITIGNTQSNVIIFVIHTQSHTQAKIINHGFRVPPPPLTPPGMPTRVHNHHPKSNQVIHQKRTLCAILLLASARYYSLSLSLKVAAKQLLQHNDSMWQTCLLGGWWIHHPKCLAMATPHQQYMRKQYLKQSTEAL